MSRRKRASTVLRDLVLELGAKEVARRTGYARSTVERAASSGKLSEGLRDGVRQAEERIERARAAAKEREAHRTRIDLPLEKVPELAKAMRVTEKTARSWIVRGASPEGARDAAADLKVGRTPLREPEAGRGEKITTELKERVERTMRGFVEAVRGKRSQEEIASAYRAWRRAKLPARRAMGKAAWSKLVTRVGKDLGLPDVGVFSSQRFRKS